jgi:hypothetical protein
MLIWCSKESVFGVPTNATLVYQSMLLWCTKGCSSGVSKKANLVTKESYREYQGMLLWYAKIFTTLKGLLNL